MKPARPALSARTELARLLVAWLVLVLCVQGWAAAQGAVLGTLHRHKPPVASTTWLPVMTHAAVKARDLAHGHAQNERHHHDQSDPSVVSVARELTVDMTVSILLGGLFSAAATRPQVELPGASAHVLRPATAWAAATHSRAPPQRPPRR